MKKSSCLKPKGLSHDFWYEALSSGLLPSLFKLYHWGKKWPHPVGHMLYIGLNREKHEKFFLAETIIVGEPEIQKLEKSGRIVAEF